MNRPASGSLRVDDFSFHLPGELIAQEPLPDREGSRLMVLTRSTGEISHAMFSDLPRHLRAADLLVVNDTKVIPARLNGRRAAPGTGGSVEFLLVERLGSNDTLEPVDRQHWTALVKGLRRAGEQVDFGSGLSGRLEERTGEGTARVVLSAPRADGGVDALLARNGVMPVPPYIRRRTGDPRAGLDNERYQTIFARHSGAVAAPTAGLHFTSGLVDAVRARGAGMASLTLHVGPGTFQPVRVEQVSDHRMQEERFSLPEATAGAVISARRRGGRVIAVGTTVCRTLESCAGPVAGSVIASEGRTGLFIHPGHRFRVVDALVTNFHLPRSTLLMLVAAFAGRELVLRAYAEAVAREYRFFSYGDAMFIV